MPDSKSFFASILDADRPSGGEHYKCAVISMSLGAARQRTDWPGGKALRRVDRWDANSREQITLKHVPTGRAYPATIFEMTPR